MIDNLLRGPDTWARILTITVLFDVFNLVVQSCAMVVDDVLKVGIWLMS